MISRMKKVILGTTLVTTVVASSAIFSFASITSYKVVIGDTLWKISQKYETTLDEIYKANPNYNKNTILMAGDVVNVPQGGQGLAYTVIKDDTPWTISNTFNVKMNDFLIVNGLQEGQHIYPGQKVIIPGNNTASLKMKPIKTIIIYTVVKGDDLWNISIKYGIPFHEIISLNSFKPNHLVNIGDKIKIPVYNIPIKQTPGSQYGELLDWWTEAQYLVPIGKVFKVKEFSTGKSWTMKRTIGANHADVEPLTSKDTAVMKEVWGGNFSWTVRPVIIEVDNRKIAASANAMPHSIQHIKDNGYNGHSCIHFFNSTRHSDGKADPSHQKSVLKAGGK
jgi:LysM repeat protein